MHQSPYKLKKFLLVLALALSCLACTLTNIPGNQAQPARVEPKKALHTPQVQKPVCMVTAQEALNVRKGPTTQSAVIAILRPGEVIAILRAEASSVWWKVQAKNVTGYINSNYCERK